MPEVHASIQQQFHDELWQAFGVHNGEVPGIFSAQFQPSLLISGERPDGPGTAPLPLCPPAISWLPAWVD
jgi:hypothetical protein